MWRHPPAVAVAIEQAKGESGAAEDIGVERVGAQGLGQFRGGAARVLRQGIPDAELPGELDEMSRVVPGHQVVELAHLVGERRRVGCVALGHHRLPSHKRPPYKDLTVEVAGSAGDRKSTSLNSSHANISYAVFCLKKK